MLQLRKMAYPVRRMGFNRRARASLTPVAPEPETPPEVAAPTWIAGGALPAGSDISWGGSAQIGDLGIIISPYGNPALGDVDWESDNFTWWSYGYQCYVFWKVLTSTANVSITGNSYGCMYGLLRDATGLEVVERKMAGGTSDSVTFADTAPQLVTVMHQSATDPTPAAGFTEHFATQISGVFMMSMATDLEDATAGAKSFSNLLNGATHLGAYKILQ